MMRWTRLISGILVASAAFFVGFSGFVGAQTMDWSGQIQSTGKLSGGSNSDVVWSVKVDEFDNKYVGGSVRGKLPGQNWYGEQDYFVRKYDQTGNVVWTHQYGGSHYDHASELVISQDGYLYVTGQTDIYNPSTGNLHGDIFLAKYNLDGEFLWYSTYGSEYYHESVARGLTITSSGRVYIGGGISLPYWSSATPPVGGSDFILIEFDTEGNFVQSKQFSSVLINNFSNDNLMSLLSDENGYLYAIGSTTGTFPGWTWDTGRSDCFVAKLNGLGDLLWVKQHGTTNRDTCLNAVLGKDSSIYMVGRTDGLFGGDPVPLGDYDAVLIKTDLNGNQLWVRQFGSSQLDEAWGVDISQSGYIGVAGNTHGPLWDSQYYGSQDGFFVQFTSEGDLSSYTVVGTTAAEVFNAIAYDKVSRGSFNIGGSILGSDGSRDGIILHFTQSMPNALPVSNAGEDRVVNEGQEVVFDGSGSSDPDGVEDIVSYEWDFGDGNFGSEMDVTHVYADNGIYTVTLTVTDSQGASDSDSVVMTVVNVAPVVNVPDTLQVFETGTINVSASFTDPGADSWVGSVDYGDGSINEDLVFIGKNFDLHHTYELPGIYTVTVTVVDDDGGVGVGVFEVATYSVSVPEGSDVSVTLGGVTIIFDEVETAGIVTFDITSHPQGGLPPSQYRFLRTYYEITTTAIYIGQITITFSYDEADVHGQEDNLKLFHWEGSGWQDITVPPVDTVNNTITGTTYTLSPFAIGDLLNLPPTVTAEGPYQVEEGGVVELTAVGYDPEGGLLIYAWDLDADGFFESVGQTVNFSAAALDGPSTHAVSVQVADEGGLTATDEAEIIVLNVAPVIGEIVTTSGPVMVGTEVSASADFSDSGLLDTHFAEWRWGDGTVSEGAVSVSAGEGYVDGLHTYIYPGVYTLTLTVTDDDGDYDTVEYAYVVVYDPEGGFVTGGGWFNSPLGAYTLNPLASGKANFGFNSKYLPGAQVPTGNTEFRFKSANLDFHSTSYEWLVVAGAQGKYKGIGNLNGDSNYGFMLSARDSAVSGGGQYDAFRIKIWEISTGQIIYDNQLGDSDDADVTTQIGGGNVVIHK